MVNDWLEENLFSQVVDEVISKANGDGRAVRAFGEMVALLWPSACFVLTHKLVSRRTLLNLPGTSAGSILNWLPVWKGAAGIALQTGGAIATTRISRVMTILCKI